MYNLKIKQKTNLFMKTKKITKDAFDAFDVEAKCKFIDDMQKELEISITKVQIGDEIFSDRESLQLWRIEKGYVMTKKN
jgi:hypothetical protein